jgi:hypothetical protein
MLKSSTLYRALLVVCTSSFSVVAAAEAASGSARVTVQEGCWLTYEYAIAREAASGFFASDKSAVAELIYEIYASTHDMHREFAPFLEPHSETVELPVQTTEGTIRPKKRKAASQKPSRTIDMPADVLASTNGNLGVLTMFDPDLRLKVTAARMECSTSAIIAMREEDATRKDHIQRALGWIADPDPNLKARGLRMLADEARDAELWSLPQLQRQQVGDLAYAEYENEIRTIMQPGWQIGQGFKMFGAELLQRMRDPRAAEAYMSYVVLNNHFQGTSLALRSLAELRPRPIQVLPHLETILAKDEHANSSDGSQLGKEVMEAIVVIGRQEARPILEKYTRSKNEALAQSALAYLDQLNTAQRTGQQ